MFLAKAAKVEAKQEPNESVKETRDDENDDNVEDKIWADVDKDLGELLQEVGNIEENDNEDEDSTATERYDCTKYFQYFHQSNQTRNRTGTTDSKTV